MVSESGSDATLTRNSALHSQQQQQTDWHWKDRPTDTMLLCLLSVFYFPEAVFVGVHREADWATPIFDTPACFHWLMANDMTHSVSVPILRRRVIC